MSHRHEDLRERLLGRLRPTLAAEPGEVRGDHDLNPGRLSVPGDMVLRPAAVLVPIIDRNDGLAMLLTRRADHLKSHAGQVSFPGGRIEPSDESPTAAALREAEEEVGLARRFVTVIGRLAPYETGTGFRVVPIVGLVEPGFSLVIDKSEVADVFEVPLAFLMDPRHHERHTGNWRGEERHFYAMPYNGQRIWGATAGMIVNLYETLFRA